MHGDSATAALLTLLKPWGMSLELSEVLSVFRQGEIRDSVKLFMEHHHSLHGNDILFSDIVLHLSGDAVAGFNSTAKKPRK